MGDLNGQGHSKTVLLAVLIMLAPPFLFAVDIIGKVIFGGDTCILPVLQRTPQAYG